MLLRRDLGQVEVANRSVYLALHFGAEHMFLVELLGVPVFVHHHLVLDILRIVHDQILVLFDCDVAVLFTVFHLSQNAFSQLLQEMLMEFIGVV